MSDEWDMKASHASGPTPSIAASPRRNGGIDALRVIGVVAIVVGHVWDNQIVREGIYTWHVPLFFVLAGYFSRPAAGFASLLRERARGLLLPYLTCGLIVGIFYLAWLLSTGEGAAVGRASLATLYGGRHLTEPFNAFWFITALFFAGILHPYLLRANLFVRAGTVVVAFSAAVAIAEPLSQLPLSIGCVPCAIVLMEIGWWGRRAGQKMGRVAMSVYSTLAALGLLAIFLGVYQPLDMKRGDLGTPVIGLLLAGVFCVSLAVLASSIRLPLHVARLATISATVALPVVLLHGLGLLLPVEGGWRVLLATALCVIPGGLALAVRPLTSVRVALTGH